jgi:Bacterial protein of unknown function (DUF961).
VKFSELDSNIYDFGKDLGKLTFISLRSTGMEADEEGNLTEVKKRVYNCLSDERRAVIQVSLPPDAGEKIFERGQEVELFNPVLRIFPKVSYPNLEVVDYITADDIIVKNGKQPTNNDKKAHN